jgi:hypothetical protein
VARPNRAARLASTDRPASLAPICSR